MVLTVTLNPSVDRAMFVEQVKMGDTNRVVRAETDAGGKGVNLSRVYSELGGETVATGFLGGGPGAFVRKVLTDQGLPHCFIDVAGETRTNISIEDLSGSLPTTFNERGPEIGADDIERLVDAIANHIPHATWISMGGSLPPGAPTDMFKRLVEMSRSLGVKSLVDADGEAMKLAMESSPDMIKPNEKEASRLLGRDLPGRNEALEAAVELYERLGGGDKIAVISRGAAGAVMACADGVFDGVSPNVDMKSTIGCGDSMLAGILWGIAQGESMEQSFKWGLAAGAATASTDGTGIARRPVVERLLPLARCESE